MRRLVLPIALFLVWAAPRTEGQQAIANAASQEQQGGAEQPEDAKSTHKAETGETEQFSEVVMESVLRQMRNGLEGRSARRFLSVFDSGQMTGYLTFADQIRQFFDAYDGLRIHYRVIQASAEGEKGIALVEMQMEATPQSGNGAPLRHDQQLRFELARGKNGWKIVDFRPRDFFMP